MPVTAKLSKLFYERLGEQVADELVGWFNAVDATYRSDLREFNELNFARFDAKLEQRLGEFAAQLRLEVNGQLTELGANFEAKFAALEAKFAALEAKFAALQVKFGELRAEVERGQKEQLRWMIAMWLTLLIPIIGFGLRH
jgi:predicted component of type VI protein secretion system